MPGSGSSRYKAVSLPGKARLAVAGGCEWPRAAERLNQLPSYGHVTFGIEPAGQDFNVDL